ncbi:MAG: ATP-binding protein [Acidobacteria bacterium]|nr:ATP-binding protein [Acidobacteriota bacterium]
MSDSSHSGRDKDRPNPAQAEAIIESLRQGIPPRRGVRLYSVGNEEFLKGVRERHLEGTSARGKIRFVSGSWGAGKTHFLRELLELAFETNYLVSTVELAVDETPFNKFERVFHTMLGKIASPEMFYQGDPDQAAPFGEVVRRTLFRGAGVPEASPGPLPHDGYQRTCERLMGNDTIDIDFRRMVVKHWETYLPEAGEPVTLADRRARVLQWFAGEGTVGSYRKEFGVQKIVSRDNARIMLRSLGRFAAHAGYRGLVILFDEAEMSYSVMRRSDLKRAHNNLLHLINGVDESEGLFLVYATTPDFYTDPKHGIQNYGALAQRIGKPENFPPAALDKVWNLDAVQPTRDHYRAVGHKLRDLYILAYPDAATRIMEPEKIETFVDELVAIHPSLSPVRTWRVLIVGVIRRFDLEFQGQKVPPTEELHENILETLKEA